MDVSFYVIVTQLIPLARRANYDAVLQISGGSGVILGLLIGAVIVEKTSWRV